MSRGTTAAPGSGRPLEWLPPVATHEQVAESQEAIASSMMGEENVRTGRLARMGSILFLMLAMVACSSSTTPSPTPATTSAATETPSPISTPGATPNPTPTASPTATAPATLKAGPKMTTALEGQAAVRLEDGRVLILGGTVPFTGACPMACVNPSTASVEIFNPATGKFGAHGSLAEPRAGAQALLLNDGRVLVSGGTGEFGADLDTIEIFDPTKGTSVVVTPPAGTPKLPVSPSTILLADGRVLIAGGSYDEYNSTSNVTLIFDPTSGAFSKGPLMAAPRQSATATLLADGRVLIVGGDYYKANYGYANNSAEAIDPSHPLSSSTLLPSPYQATSTLLSDGRVLVVGASKYDQVAGCMAPTDAVVFDPGTAGFTAVDPMKTPRTGSAAVRVQDGRVLLLGGRAADCKAVGTVEAFDPGTGTFHAILTGFPAIQDFSATLLDDGEILILGGYGEDGQMRSGSWLLKP
jgi:hypothetical protein